MQGPACCYPKNNPNAGPWQQYNRTKPAKLLGYIVSVSNARGDGKNVFALF